MPLLVQALETVSAPVGPPVFWNHGFQKSRSSPRLANRLISSVLTFKALPENSSHLSVFMILPRNFPSRFSLLKKSYFSAQQSFLYSFPVSFHLHLIRQELSIPNPRSVGLYFFSSFSRLCGTLQGDSIPGRLLMVFLLPSWTQFIIGPLKKAVTILPRCLYLPKIRCQEGSQEGANEEPSRLLDTQLFS